MLWAGWENGSVGPDTITLREWDMVQSFASGVAKYRSGAGDSDAVRYGGRPEDFIGKRRSLGSLGT